MAVPTPTKICKSAIGTGGYTLLYTAPALTTTILKSFDICNTTTRMILVRVHIVDVGDAEGTDNALLYDLPIPAYGKFGWEGEQVLAAGDFFSAEGNAAGLCIIASGVQLA